MFFLDFYASHACYYTIFGIVVDTNKYVNLNKRYNN